MPHPSDLPEVLRGLRHRYKTWGEVLTAAGVLDTTPLPPLGPLEAEYTPLLESVRRRAEALNRAPLRREVEPQTVEALVKRCGSWRRVLEQVDLEPVRRIAPFSNTRLGDRSGKAPGRHRGSLHDCYYRLLRVDEATALDLETVAEAARRLGRSPSGGGSRRPAAPGPTPSTSWGWSPAVPADPFPSTPPSSERPICEVSSWIRPL